jgi:hypothetical protein
MMNEELKQLALQAGAPTEVIDQLWFNIFCMRFASVVITEAEHELAKVKARVKQLEE